MSNLTENKLRLETVMELDLGSPIGQCRAVPVRLKERTAFLAAYCADVYIDPSPNMFFLPTDTLKLALFTESGEVLWKRDLGRSIIPGLWFCPVYPFDLDGDGIEEIWYVGNDNTQHPLDPEEYTLDCLDALTGELKSRTKWPNHGGIHRPLFKTFRNFIMGGYVRGEPVLVTAQGTYGDMYIQGWNADRSMRWETAYEGHRPGASGSHMCPVVDLNNDGVDELLWGERCIELDRGAELFCADRDVYGGHSDVIQPVLLQESGRWLIYTIRESEQHVPPRVATFDDQGNRVWGAVDHGHMDMGWVARLGDERDFTAMAIRIGSKSLGPDGLFHFQVEEFTYELRTGTPCPLPYSIYRTLPVDLNGDGYHELVRGNPDGQCEVLDGAGNVLAHIGGSAAMLSKFLDLPGEQLLSYYEDGRIRIWADRNAVDNAHALVRYRHPFYRAAQRLTASGYNLTLLGGL